MQARAQRSRIFYFPWPHLLSSSHINHLNAIPGPYNSSNSSSLLTLTLKRRVGSANRVNCQSHSHSAQVIANKIGNTNLVFHYLRIFALLLVPLANSFTPPFSGLMAYLRFLLSVSVLWLLLFIWFSFITNRNLFKCP